MEVVRYQVPGEPRPREVRWAETAEDWGRVAAVVRREGICGWDSEFHGFDIRNHSPAARAVVHVFSLAVFNGALHPRGHRLADPVVLPGNALFFGPIADVLADPGIIKTAHNARSEYHAAAAHAGIRARGVVDTQDLARFIYPERVGLPGHPYGLKEMFPYVGRTAIGEYKELFSEPNTITVRRHRKERSCSCGTPGCRLRKGHTRIDTVREWDEEVVRGTRLIPQETIRAGHPKWDLFRVYAGEDAYALELYDHLRIVGIRRDVPNLWTRQAGYPGREGA